MSGDAEHIVLSLDPSSSCTGYAVVAGDSDRYTPPLIEAGKLRGKANTSPVVRVLSMRDELLEILAEVKPDVVLVEMPVERQYSRTPGKRSGMAVWAGAAWAIWMVAVDWIGDVTRVRAISNTDWTKGTTKQQRQLSVQAAYPNYTPAKDKGGDVADAVAMALWWIENTRKNLVARHTKHAGKTKRT